MTIDEQRLYEEHILVHYEEPYHNEKYADATHQQRIDNPVCGDSVELQLSVSEDRIVSQAWFTGTGCVISQSSASMLVEYIEEKGLEELTSFTAEDMLNLFQARLTPRRQQCCLLAWQALHQLSSKIVG